MLLTTANRECLQSLLKKFPDACRALESATPYWSQDSMIISCQTNESRDILKKYFSNTRITEQMLGAIPVKSFIVEPLVTDLDIEMEVCDAKYQLHKDYWENITSSTTNFQLAIESAHTINFEDSFDMANALLDAVEQVDSPQFGSEVSTVKDMINLLAGAVNSTPEQVQEELFSVTLPRQITSSLMTSFFSSRILNANKTAPVEKAKAKEVKKPEAKKEEATVPPKEEPEAKKSASTEPAANAGEKINPSAILKQENLPTRYKLLRTTPPPKPPTRHTQAAIAKEDDAMKAYLQAGVERITTNKKQQFYIFKAIADNTPAGEKVYIPELLDAYKIYESSPEQQTQRVAKIQNVAAMILGEMSQPQEATEAPDAAESEE